MTELQQQILKLKKTMSPKEISYDLKCSLSTVYKTKHKESVPINWKCECWYESHHYYITCPICGIENPLDGKKNKLWTQN